MSNALFEKTDSDQQIRDVISFDRLHEDFLLALIDEIRRRTGYRIDKSSVVRTLVESMMRAEMEPGDITNLYRRDRCPENLQETMGEISEQIAEIESDLRLALIDYSTETPAVRQLRRNLRYQKERLRAVEMQMTMERERVSAEQSSADQTQGA
jgi:hypothetical protein